MLEDAIVKHPTTSPRFINTHTELNKFSLLKDINDEFCDIEKCISIILDGKESLSELSMKEAYRITTLMSHFNKLSDWLEDPEVYHILNDMIYSPK